MNKFEKQLVKLLDEFFEDFYEWRATQGGESFHASIDFFRTWLKNDKQFLEDWRERKDL